MSINIWQTPNTWIEQGGGVTVTATEILNSFTDSANVNVDYNVSLLVTESFNKFIDNSLVRLPVNWNNKPVAVTSYTVKTPTTTIWIDKG